MKKLLKLTGIGITLTAIGVAVRAKRESNKNKRKWLRTEFMRDGRTRKNYLVPR